jgi:hypothetical protein
LIDGLIPRGKITLVSGDPGKGKSLLTTDLAAGVSTGRGWVGGPCTAGSVLMLSAEDGAADTIVPRLHAAGADVSKIRVSGVETLLDLPDQIATLEAVTEADGAHLVILDPLNAFLNTNINSTQDASVRRALAPLAGLAERTGAAVVVVFHLNKDGGKDGKQALYRPTGSVGFVAASRAAFLLAPDPKNDDQRVLAPLKFNLGPMPSSWAFAIRAHQLRPGDDRPDQAIETARIEWIGESHLTADDLLGRGVAASDDEGKLGEAVAFLRGLLADGAKSHQAIQAGARANGISDMTLRRAKEKLGAVAFQPAQKTGKRGSPGWLWRLPGGSDESGVRTPPKGTCEF